MRITSTWDLVGTPPHDVPTEFAEPCARVGNDLRRTIPADVPPDTCWTLTEDSHDGARTLLLGLRSEAFQFSRSTEQSPPAGQLTAYIAELVQDHLSGFEFIQWPPCPGHSHPMEPAADDAGAWWRCRTSHHNLAPIGDLPR